MNRQATWRQSISSLVVSIFVLLTIRWVAFEPYVIPSGSMLPTLKVLDFIYVNKFAYGLRWPFSSQWLFQRNLPKRCEIVVFRSQTEPGIFLIKRVMGLPGEKIELFESGRIHVNDKLLPVRVIREGEDFTTYAESCEPEGGAREHTIQLANGLRDLPTDPIVYSMVVPPDHLLMFGDNRHESADSRVWGALPRSELLGRALGIWLSCENSLPGMPRLCDPSSLRLNRMFHEFDEVDQ